MTEVTSYITVEKKGYLVNEQLISYTRKTEIGSLSHMIQKINFWCIKNLNMKDQTLKLQNKNRALKKKTENF